MALKNNFDLHFEWSLKTGLTVCEWVDNIPGWRWVGGWMDKRVDGWTDMQMEWTDVRMDVRMDRWMDVKMNGSMALMDGLMSTDGWIDEH